MQSLRANLCAHEPSRNHPIQSSNHPNARLLIEELGAFFAQLVDSVVTFFLSILGYVNCFFHFEIGIHCKHRLDNRILRKPALVYRFLNSILEISLKGKARTHCMNDPCTRSQSELGPRSRVPQSIVADSERDPTIFDYYQANQLI